MHLAPLIALIAGAASAGLYVFGLTQTVTSIFVLALVPLPLWLAGLGAGATAAGLAAAVGSIGVFALVDNTLAAPVYIGMLALPAYLLIHLAMQRKAGDDGAEPEWFPAGALAGSLLAIGLLQSLAVAGLLGATGDGLVATSRQILESTFGSFVTTDMGDGTGAIIDQWDSLFLGTVVAAGLLAQAACAALAQGLLASFGRKQRPTPAFWTLRIGDWARLLVVPLLAAVVALDLSETGAEGAGGFALFLLSAFVLVLGVGFLLQGLAVAHALTRGMRMQPLILGGVYVIALAMPPFGPALFALVGFFDRWGNFRERFGVDVDAGMED